jgi:hypothetical protein
MSSLYSARNNFLRVEGILEYYIQPANTRSLDGQRPFARDENLSSIMLKAESLPAKTVIILFIV